MFPVRGADRQKKVPPCPTEWCLKVYGLGQHLKAAGSSDLQEDGSKAESRSATLPVAQAWAPFSPSCTGAVHEAGKAAQGRETRNPLTQPQGQTQKDQEMNEIAHYVIVSLRQEMITGEGLSDCRRDGTVLPCPSKGGDN